MARADFEKFVTEHARAASGIQSIDWDLQKREWLEHLAVLYKRISGYLSDFTNTHRILLSTSTVRLEEDFVGEYSATQMTISIGDKQVRLVPVGTNLIAAKGRVDMRSPNGLRKILLVDSRMTGLRDHIYRMDTSADGEPGGPMSVREQPAPVWEWKLLTPPPMSKYLELNEDSFLDALMELADD